MTATPAATATEYAAAAFPETKTRSFFVDRPLLLLALFSALYLAVFAGHLDSGDSAYRIAWAKSMLFHGTARIDDAGLGASYCKYAIGHSLLAMPFLLVSAGLNRMTHLHAEGPIYMLLFVFNAAVFLVLVAQYLRMRFDAHTTARALFVLGFATVWLPCSRTDSIEQLVLTFLFAGFLLVKKHRPIAGMLLASFAIVIRPDALIAVSLLAVWTAWPARDWPLAMRMGLACVPALAVNLAANWVRWGTWREAGYSGETFSYPALAGLYGILFSAGRSVFFYSPPLLLGVAALFRFARSGHGSRDYWFFAAVFASEALLYSAWWDWSGDDCWALRFLTPGVMLLCIPAAEYLGGLRFPRVPAAIAAMGLAVQTLAVVVDPMAADLLIRNRVLPKMALYPGQAGGAANRADIDDLRYHPRFSPLAVNGLLLAVRFGYRPALQRDPLELARTGTPLYDSLIASGWDPNSVQTDLFWIRVATGRKP